MGRRSRRIRRSRQERETAVVPETADVTVTAGLAVATAAVPGPEQETGEDGPDGLRL